MLIKQTTFSLLHSMTMTTIWPSGSLLLQWYQPGHKYLATRHWQFQVWVSANLQKEDNLVTRQSKCITDTKSIIRKTETLCNDTDKEGAKKVVSDSPGLGDFATGLVIFVLNLPDRLACLLAYFERIWTPLTSFIHSFRFSMMFFSSAMLKPVSFCSWSYVC